jgi:hypothetical protein
MDWPGLYRGTPIVRLSLNASVVRGGPRGTALRILSHQFRDVPAVAAVRTHAVVSCSNAD